MGSETRQGLCVCGTFAIVLWLGLNNKTVHSKIRLAAAELKARSKLAQVGSDVS